MPITGKVEPPPNQPLYFRSLKDLDAWSSGKAGDRYDGILKYTPRKPNTGFENKGKLLVCHDYKGGYKESSFSRCYTFNFWSSCETFVYFAHHRITVPPPGWVSAAHRQGVKMLGTIIFEPQGGGEEDCLRLIVGKMPSSRTGQVDQTAASFTLPLSPHYAKILAELARERGFDGYLLNFECPLVGKVEQTRALAAWITLLQSELLSKVGPHAQTIWYDSVIIDGRLAWQDRLNSLNLPYFLSATGLFSNYTWFPDYPDRTARYFLNLDPTLVGNTAESKSHLTTKTLQDIYMGIDVWGRGSHGGGGFGSYKALSHISPETLGLSVAIFGQAWTWESEQDKPGWNWDKWWEYESKLWVGPISGPVEVPEVPPRKNEPVCVHGPFSPITPFFARLPPPDPADVSFHTTFCPGTGLSWFVEGNKVFHSPTGWTDVDKQTSVGDLLWPCPKVYWEDDREDELPTVLSSFCMDDAWSGGNSIRFGISSAGSKDESAAYRPYWLPVHTLRLTTDRQYEASAIYKREQKPTHTFETEFALSVNHIPGEASELEYKILSTATTDLANGWTKLSIQFKVLGGGTPSISSSTAAIGLVVAVTTEETDKPLKFSFLLGQINVHPRLPRSYTEEDTMVLWADYAPLKTSTRGAAPLFGRLTWDVTTSFPAITSISITSPEDPVSAWNLQPTINWFPSFLYFNIYAQPFISDRQVGKVDQAVWIGTSGSDGQKNGFDIVPENLPFPPQPGAQVRFYVRGVTDRGETMKWAKCAFVDVKP